MEYLFRLENAEQLRDAEHDLAERLRVLLDMWVRAGDAALVLCHDSTRRTTCRLQVS